MSNIRFWGIFNLDICTYTSITEAIWLDKYQCKKNWNQPGFILNWNASKNAIKAPIFLFPIFSSTQLYLNAFYGLKIIKYPNVISRQNFVNYEH